MSHPRFDNHNTGGVKLPPRSDWQDMWWHRFLLCIAFLAGMVFLFTLEVAYRCDFIAFLNNDTEQPCATCKRESAPDIRKETVHERR
ncbi:MAG: hypothetical protein WC045_04400 [Patescibacteria group bacterium]